MKLIKLNAIDSTNSFLKELAQNSTLEQFTVVVTNNQTSGRGQINNSWMSEPYKNLTFSLFTPLKNVEIKHQAFLNFAVSLAIYDVLTSLSIPKLSIKWPNDILSDNLKICGILIETTFSQQRIKNTIIGIGLNVNQEKFSKNLPNASSLRMLVKKNFDLEILMNDILKKIKSRFSSIENGNLKKIYEDYHEVLYKKGTPITFYHKQKELYFMGIIIGVSYIGNLQIQLEDNTILECGIKEISFAKV